MACNAYTFVGKKGTTVIDPSFTYGKPLELRLAHDGDIDHARHRSTGWFGGELRYFSDCILEGHDPRPTRSRASPT